jgi:hypothetical protein
MTFAVGAGDADILNKEFAEVFTANDLVNLGRFQVATKMTIDSQVTRPFVSTTLPLPISSNENRQKVIDISRERWTKTIGQEVVATNNFGSQTPIPAGSTPTSPGQPPYQQNRPHYPPRQPYRPNNPNR